MGPQWEMGSRVRESQLHPPSVSVKAPSCKQQTQLWFAKAGNEVVNARSVPESPETISNTLQAARWMPLCLQCLVLTLQPAHHTTDRSLHMLYGTFISISHKILNERPSLG